MPLPCPPQVSLSFHATDTVPLPAWVAEIGRANPDIYFTDRAGARFTDCLSLGVDDGGPSVHALCIFCLHAHAMNSWCTQVH